MTEREPDHLFEELRRKLEDYGSHPSTDVWAGLEQHLTSQPQRRPYWQRHWRWLAAACLLLLLSIPAFLWLRSAPGAQPTTAAATVASTAGPTAAGGPATTPATAATPSTTAQSTRPATIDAGRTGRPAGSATTSAPGLPEAVAAAPGASSAAAGSVATGSGAPMVGTVTSPAPPAPSPLVRRKRRGDAGTLAEVKPAVTRRANDPTGTIDPAQTEPAGLLTAETRPRRRKPTASAAATYAATSASINRAPAGTGLPAETGFRTGIGPAQPSVAAAGATKTAVGSTSGSSGASAQSATGAATPGAEQSVARQLPGTQPTGLTPGGETSLGGATAATGRSAPADISGAATQASSRPAAAVLAAPALLAGRAVPLQLTDSPLPTPLSGVPVLPPAPQPPLPGRWSLAVLAGPGLSYRQLQNDSASTNELARLERPALGYAVQAELGYALTPRLRVVTGLGYAEYATRLEAVVNKARIRTDSIWQVQIFDNGTRRDTLRFLTRRDTLLGYERVPLRQRDTYRYLTLPVQARFSLGQYGRWSYEVLGGAALGLYLGGRTTEGSGACNCEQTSWRPGQKSPFRVTSVLLTAGAAAEYQLRPGWHLLLQPVLHYSLSPITESPRPLRRPAALFVQTGLRFDLP